MQPSRLVPVIKQGKAFADHIRTVITRHYKCNVSQYKRISLVVASAVVVLATTSVYDYYQDSEAKKGELQTILVAKNKEIKHTENKLSELSESLQEVKKQKADIDLQLKEKTQQTADLQSQIDSTPVTPTVEVVSGGRGGSEGNSYDPGYCTWYVKSKRPDIPNNLGDASQWLSGAIAAGYKTGLVPVAGAIGTSSQGYYGHVVYVESVVGDMVNISEMNYSGWNTVSYRTTAASDFTYIY